MRIHKESLLISVVRGSSIKSGAILSYDLLSYINNVDKCNLNYDGLKETDFVRSNSDVLLLLLNK